MLGDAWDMLRGVPPAGPTPPWSERDRMETARIILEAGRCVKEKYGA
jgi:hypothetical protein